MHLPHLALVRRVIADVKSCLLNAKRRLHGGRMRWWEDGKQSTVSLNMYSQSSTLVTPIIFNRSVLNQTHRSHKARYTVYVYGELRLCRHKEPIKSAEGARPQRMYAAHAGSETRDGWVICSQERHINISSTPLQLRALCSMLHASCAAAETRCSEPAPNPTRECGRVQRVKKTSMSPM